jgi:hypothetical protein
MFAAAGARPAHRVRAAAPIEDRETLGTDEMEPLHGAAPPTAAPSANAITSAPPATSPFLVRCDHVVAAGGEQRFHTAARHQYRPSP